MHFIPPPKAFDPSTDPRYTHKGKWSSWLIKAKSDGAKAKWFQTLGRRYFTIDFDRQVFYYAHGESWQAQVSSSIRFSEILGAHTGHSYEPDSSCEQANGGLNRSFSSVLSRQRVPPPGIYPFTVRTAGKRLRLEAEVESETVHWIAMLNAASRLGRGVDLLVGDDLEVDERSCRRAATPDSSSASARSDGEKAPSLMSEKASQQSTTADGEENGTDTPPSPKELSDAGNIEELRADQQEEPTAWEMQNPIAPRERHQEGQSGPCLRSYLGSSACSVASGSQPGSPREAAVGSLQAADFGFEEDDLARDEEASPEPSPIASPRPPLSEAQDAAAAQQIVLCEGSEDEASPISGRAAGDLMDTSRVATDMMLLQRQASSVRPKRRSGGEAAADAARYTSGQQEDVPSSLSEEKDRAARVAADLMLLQAEAVKRSSLTSTAAQSLGHFRGSTLLAEL